ncbi:MULTISPECIES: hypothetical protein [unclassified Fibrobacter]|uniref:hypothetical protein n=1 Tax=unclassified Fibrobacter TaxID=2634177 RepID=UPI000D6BA496|nr:MULTISPECIES: hypothetical protein [unclassified Fibrobacter]PWJ69023.1 hypothetical protein BGX12_10678 [Fibrobacter sp. UWR4]PZW70869.1 hypothetical protein C8E88_101061 [Fibrobacter sp. UWR1]
MKHFMNMVAEAAANKEKFDSDLNSLKVSLSQSVNSSEEVFVAPSPKTGWLKGSLSYPWVLICSIVPAIKEVF